MQGLKPEEFDKHIPLFKYNIILRLILCRLAKSRNGSSISLGQNWVASNGDERLITWGISGTIIRKGERLNQ